MTRTFTVLFLLAALFTLTACPPDPGASSSSSSEPVSGVTTNIIENAMTIYFRDGYPYADPVMWLWISNSNGMNVAASGTTNLNGFAFKVYTTNVRSLMLSNFNLNPVRVTTNGLRYYFKFKDGTAGTQWEWMAGLSCRNFLTSGKDFTNYAISYNRLLFGTNLPGMLSNPDSVNATNMQGANLQPDGSTVYFSLFAPSFTKVTLPGTFNSWSLTADNLSLTPDGQFWWIKKTIASAAGNKYKFYINGNTWLVDPYAKAAVNDGGDCFIVDTNYTWTATGWTRPSFDKLVIYEIHVKDFTSQPTSGVVNKGKYAGVIEKIPYLTNLGINAVEFMPISEFGDSGYSWGYNTALFFAPDSLFSTTNDGRQVQEFKELIDELHKAGIAVIMDMVYNHTGGSNPFWAIDEVYYFDWNNDGKVEAGEGQADATPWGNHFNSWRPYTMKLIFDNLKYFFDTYQIDGFRFDATEYVDIAAMTNVVKKLKTAGYSDRYYIFEEFNGSHNAVLHNFQNAENLKLASWGTGFKNAVWNALGVPNQTGDLGNVTYFSKNNPWTKPQQVLNYFSSHDEGTLAGKGLSKQKTKLAFTHLLTAMGIPMFWMGEEFMRVHYGNTPPTGDSTAEANNTNMHWDLAVTNADLVAYASALVKLRIAHPALRQVNTDPSVNGLFSWTVASWTSNAIGYTYLNNSGDNNFVVLLNFSSLDKTYSVTFPNTGTWYVMSDGTNASHVTPGLGSFTAPATSNIDVPANSGVIYMSDLVN